MIDVIYPGFSYNNANTEAQVEVTLKVMERARIHLLLMYQLKKDSASYSNNNSNCLFTNP